MGDQPLSTVSLPVDLAHDAEETVYGGTATVHLVGGARLQTSPAAAQVVDLWLEGHAAETAVTLVLPTYQPGESIGLSRTGSVRVRLTAIAAVEVPWSRPDTTW